MRETITVNLPRLERYRIRLLTTHFYTLILHFFSFWQCETYLAVCLPDRKTDSQIGLTVNMSINMPINISAKIPIYFTDISINISTYLPVYRDVSVVFRV